MTKEVLCKVANTPPKVEGIEREKEAMLRSRKNRKPNQTEIDKWREVYRILFPGDLEIPPASEKILEPTAEHDC